MDSNIIGEKYGEALARLRTLVKDHVPNFDEDLPWILVSHKFPDSDAYACLWLSVRRIVGTADFRFVFVNAGQRLSEEESAGHRVMYMDTSGGPFDQHGKGLKNASSFQLMCEHFGFAHDEALWPIIKMTIDSDNIRKMDPMSIHYVLSGLSAYHREGDEIQWMVCLDAAFMMFDILYGREQQRLQSIADVKKFAKCYTLDNGMNIALIWGKPQLREAAFEIGADVVFWTVHKGKRFQVGIALNRDTSDKVERGMESLVAGIRINEAKKRDKDSTGHNLRADRVDADTFGAWFLHDSKRLILCGSRSASLAPEDYTKLAPHEIKKIIDERLGNDATW